MLQSIIIIDPKSELTAKQGINNLLVEPPTDPKGKTKDIGIDQIRHLVLWSNQTAYLDQPRFAVISQASRLGLAAQQALLKTLEEPAADLTIIICPVQAADLLPTIRSRCATYQLNQLSPNQLNHWQLIQSPVSNLQPPAKPAQNFSEWLELDPWSQFSFLADYLKAKKDPQQLLRHWQTQLTSLPQSPSTIKQAGYLQQAVQDLQSYAPARLVFIRLHHLINKT